MRDIPFKFPAIYGVFILIMLTGCKTYVPSISSDMPFQSRYLTIDGDRIHYLDVGQGSPMLFLHGIPMSSFAWRNIIPHLADTARCIALDFMGFGKSAKPDISYTYADQIEYVEKFIDSLNLSDITLVATDIGGIIGTNYAIQHPEKIKGIVMMETPLGSSVTFHKNGGMMQRMMFWMSRQKKMGYNRIVKKNMFIKMMPMQIKRKLTDIERSIYAAPFTTENSRIPIHTLAKSFSGKDGNTTLGSMSDLLNINTIGMTNNTMPKLLLYASPGMLVNKKARSWAAHHLQNIEIEYVGKARHLIEEDLPHEIGAAIRTWYLSL